MIGNVIVETILTIMALSVVAIIWLVAYCVLKTVSIVKRTNRRVFK